MPFLGLVLAGCQDKDGDGFADDCADDDPTAHPDAFEACDGVDNNCDGRVDEGWGADLDADGFGDPGASAACATAAMVFLEPDCDDADANAFPGADELCNDLDDDCDGVVDDGLPPVPVFIDADLDGAGLLGAPTSHCDGPGFALDAGDCDDADPLVNPLEPEYCDEVDNDCDREVDEDSPFGLLVFRDADGDDHGDPETWMIICATDPPTGWVVSPAQTGSSADCDDTDPRIPYAGEPLSFCTDGKDNDCNGLTDEQEPDCQ